MNEEKGGGRGERKRESDRQTDRQTDRQRQTETGTHRETETQTQTDIKNAVNFPVKVSSHYNTYGMYTMVPQGYDQLSITVLLLQDALSVAMENHTP